MECQVTSSRTQSLDGIKLLSAWHLLTFLLRIRRHASSSEISRRCSIFHARPHLVEHLCFLPDSPLLLTGNGLVAPSCAAFAVLQRFFLKFSLRYRFFRPSRILDDVVWTYSRRRKRKRLESEFIPTVRRRVSLQSFTGNEDNVKDSLLPNETQTPSPEEATMIMKCELHNLDNVVVKTPLSMHLKGKELISGWDYFEHNDSAEIQDIKASSTEYLQQNPMLFHFLNVEHKPDITDVLKSDSFLPHIMQSFELDELVIRNSTSDSAAYEGDFVWSKFSLLEADFDGHACEDTNVGTIEGGIFADVSTGNTFHIAHDKDFGNAIQSVCSAQTEISHRSESRSFINNKSSCSIRKKEIVLNQDLLSAKKRHHSSKLKISLPLKENCTKQQVVYEQLNKGVVSSKKLLSPRDSTSVQLKSKPKKTEQTKDNKEKLDCSKDNRENHSPTTRNLQEVKPLPKFDSFIVEEEEGSGGYGIVYRAQRKEDGKTFAIKCPHANVNKYHVHNELRMLERFGGKNFVIKYEGSFKIENREYLVLEHVEHEKPEVLKREIDIFQLQWYGYCMFRALAGLHKQGIIHRDVKPGNFLFSRKFNKGFLIDFNLALDLNHKYGNVDKSTVASTSTLNKIPVPPKSFLQGKQNFSIGKTPIAMDLDRGRYSKSVASSKYQRNKTGEYRNGGSELDGNNNGLKSQGENGSGLTSTRTRSGERFREPVPVQGRKELLNLIQNAMQAPRNNESSSLSLASSKRKRVSALSGRIDKRSVYLTPMPLNSHGILVAGAGPAHKKGDGKHKLEGPCVGTKGFRAPEVLLRSAHQGPKLDIWSAGVTLLYFLIGRTPFTGEPEQNIKEIAKLRGSEDIWEVAKLHEREASFPSDLLDTQFLQCTNIMEWCKKNTKKMEFLEQTPKTLIHLVDKCLTVNPRRRLSAEEALKHPFFEPCHDKLKRYRLRKEVIQNGH